jgi:hypothetical protein
MMTGYICAACFLKRRLGLAPHCHHNFGYYLIKYPIPGAVMSDRSGPRCALEGKVVYADE